MHFLQTNCLTEIFVDRALARAKEVDDHLKVTGKVVGPLHGLPVSLKDQFSIKGLETIMGKRCESAGSSSAHANSRIRGLDRPIC